LLVQGRRFAKGVRKNTVGMFLTIVEGPPVFFFHIFLLPSPPSLNTQSGTFYATTVRTKLRRWSNGLGLASN
jgi:hypothetical protein